MVRLKDRYLLVNILYSDLPPGHPKDAPVPDLLLYNQPTAGELRPQHLLKAIRGEVAALFGDCGAGAVDRSLQVKYLSSATSTFILRISRAHYRLVWAALAFMNSLPVGRPGRPCVYRVVRVSGTMRKVEQAAIQRAKLLMLAARDEMAGNKNTSALDALFKADKVETRRLAAPTQDQDEPDEDVAMDED
ncbi:ribonuclease P/MRP protein subunit POP5 [Diplogelasinospora grovesii]|uniref:Ribonuclease P/MRP protein subunit POP5 n=1 Tax=Diplogelasinospora grovesii TaxID=303347 RepID=A0AAN6S341_9PEZI|nr:ribonuclease P/MRP protein subunit POP5 [Diplogelasinospora grovesii]